MASDFVDSEGDNHDDADRADDPTPDSTGDTLNPRETVYKKLDFVYQIPQLYPIPGASVGTANFFTSFYHYEIRSAIQTDHGYVEIQFRGKLWEPRTAAQDAPDSGGNVWREMRPLHDDVSWKLCLSERAVHKIKVGIERNPNADNEDSATNALKAVNLVCDRQAALARRDQPAPSQDSVTEESERDMAARQQQEMDSKFKAVLERGALVLEDGFFDVLMDPDAQTVEPQEVHTGSVEEVSSLRATFKLRQMDSEQMASLISTSPRPPAKNRCTMCGALKRHHTACESCQRCGLKFTDGMDKTTKHFKNCKKCRCGQDFRSVKQATEHAIRCPVMQEQDGGSSIRTQRVSQASHRLLTPSRGAGRGAHRQRREGGHANGSIDQATTPAQRLSSQRSRASRTNVSTPTH